MKTVSQSIQSSCISVLVALILNGGVAHASDLSSHPRKASNIIKGTESIYLTDQRVLQYDEGPPRKQAEAQSHNTKGDLKMAREEKWKTTWEQALLSPTDDPTDTPSSSPTQVESANLALSYIPGKLNNYQNGVLLSEGLQSRIIATSLEKVQFADGSFSRFGFHDRPDGAAVFADPETGGWSYVSNSERENGDGGVGAIIFNADGAVVGYKHLQVGTSWNCSGGKTPW